jgi:DNA recombination protein RmuC
MFLPGESFLISALEHDSSLIEKANDQHIILATPITMLALLRAVEFGWQQKIAAENADQIRLLGKELYDNVSELKDHFNRLGTSLRQAVQHFNKAVGPLESGMLDPARQLKSLGAASSSNDIGALALITTAPKTLHIPESVTPEPPNPIAQALPPTPDQPEPR